MKVVSIGKAHQKTRRCVISLGVGKKAFTDGLLRLEESLRRVGFEGDYIYWSDNLPEGCPDHFETPFGFKTYCFFEAKRLGYEEVLWMDSTCVAIRPLNSVFSQIEKNGYIIFNNNYGQMMGQWCSDEALAHNAISREQALTIPEIPCSALGFDLSSEIGLLFLEKWHQTMGDGITARGTSRRLVNWDEYQAIFWNRDQCISADLRVKGHRCDQPAAGIVAHQLGMKPYADELRDIHFKEKPIKANTAILHHREFGEQITPLSQIYRRVFFEDPYLKPLVSQGRALGSRLKRLVRKAGNPLI
jgi:hypothetical protein